MKGCTEKGGNGSPYGKRGKKERKKAGLRGGGEVVPKGLFFPEPRRHGSFAVLVTGKGGV